MNDNETQGEIITKDNLPDPIYNDNGKMIDAWFIGKNGPVHVVAGENQHILKNGAIYDSKLARIAGQPVTSTITPERSQELQARRKQVTREAIIQTISNGGGGSLRGGIKKIAEAQLDLVAQRGAYSTKAAEFLLKHADLTGEMPQEAAGMTLSMDSGTAQALIDALRGLRSADNTR